MLSKFEARMSSYCTSSHRSPEEYGDWFESYDNSLESVVLGEFEYPDVLSSLDFSKDGEAYVVWVEYSHGDSFGRSERSGTEVVGVFKDIESARELQTAIGKHRPDDSERWQNWTKAYLLELETSDGQKFELHTSSWHDYFGGLDEVHIDKVPVLIKRA